MPLHVPTSSKNYFFPFFPICRKMHKKIAKLLFFFPFFPPIFLVFFLYLFPTLCITKPAAFGHSNHHHTLKSESVVLWGKVHKKLHLPFQEVKIPPPMVQKLYCERYLSIQSMLGKKKKKNTNISIFSTTPTYLKQTFVCFFSFFFLWTFP